MTLFLSTAMSASCLRESQSLQGKRCNEPGKLGESAVLVYGPAGLLDVRLHLLHQGCNGGEGSDLPKVPDEIHPHFLAVEVPIEVEDMQLDRRRGALERGP